MASLTDSNSTDDEDRSEIVIHGDDEGGSPNGPVTVITEDGIKKLSVKATSVPESVGNLLFQNAFEVGNPTNDNMNQNGSLGSPVEFRIDPDPTVDLIINSFAFSAFDGGMKIDKFLGQNSALTNGLLVEIKSDDSMFQFEPIQTTQDFDALFSWGSGRSFELIFASGNDSMVSRFGPSTPFLLRSQGTFGTDDYIKIFIQDNLSNIAQLRFTMFAAKDM